ncbi:MAG TPA: HAD-IIIA family hydrolase [Actinomycetes bacterium]|jgi:histidinol-phosphate phosphatase family protein|nr:HAD-IIIA family hydrolase [Actinomycetes bacterium]
MTEQASLPGPRFDVVVPTVGRPSLAVLLEALASQAERLPGLVVLVDDRRDRGRPLLPCGPPAALAGLVRVVPGRARGPAAARNAGWRAGRQPWAAFLDDDVVPGPAWAAELRADLAGLPPTVAGSQGRVEVPLPRGRRPTDWERNVHGLESARWATADLAYRRSVLAEVGGFDERFPRAYREDADLGLRVVRAGYRIERGQRTVRHPVRPAGPLVSVRLQAGNADDALMRALHGPGWRAAAGVPRGRRGRHLAVTAAGTTALAALAAGRSRLAAIGSALWLAGTAELAWARIAPGPRTRAEVARMLGTSVLLPAAATWHWLAGLARTRLLAGTTRRPRARPPAPGVAPRARPPAPGVAPPVDPQAGPRRPARPDPWHRDHPARPGRDAVVPARPGPDAGTTARAEPLPEDQATPARPAAVLLDRDGTLVVDVPYNGDPARVEVMPSARRALERLRAAGVPTAVVSNQSGVGRGLLTLEQVAAVNRRVEELLGPLGPWVVCPHAPGQGCGCRKPAPGLVEQAAGRLGVDPRGCVVIGDVGADVEAALAAGARAVLVPTPATRPEEVAAAPEVAADLEAAVDLVLGARAGRAGAAPAPGLEGPRT